MLKSFDLHLLNFDLICSTCVLTTYTLCGSLAQRTRETLLNSDLCVLSTHALLHCTTVSASGAHLCVLTMHTRPHCTAGSGPLPHAWASPLSTAILTHTCAVLLLRMLL